MNTSISYIVHADPRGGYWAEVPDIPGCVTEADTPEELAFMVRDAVRGCLNVYLNRMRREAPRRRIGRNAQMATVSL